MKTNCQDRDRIFLDASPEEWSALELHAQSCPDCAREIDEWKNLSALALEMREEPENPLLWPRISAALQEQTAANKSSSSFWRRFAAWSALPLHWQTVVAAAMVVALTFSVGYFYAHRDTGNSEDQSLLKSPALREVERSETAYEQAIERLAGEAKPQLDNADSPIMANYREKLLVLDGAIDELRAEAGQNPSNAHLRRQLLAMYQEKQETLQEVLESHK